jgi:hypothetical protein
VKLRSREQPREENEGSTNSNDDIHSADESTRSHIEETLNIQPLSGRDPLAALRARKKMETAATGDGSEGGKLSLFIWFLFI